MDSNGNESKSFGMVFGTGGMSVAVWLDAATNIVTAVYNMSDSTGDHSFPVRKKNALPHKAELLEMRQKAESIAREKYAYRMARRRDTTIENLRYAFLVTIGRGGHTVYCDEEKDCTSIIQGYGLTSAELAEIERLGIPFVDTTTVPDDRIVRASFGFPMWPGKPERYDAAPWDGLSEAPIQVCAAMWAAIGAIVRNIPDIRMPEASELRNLNTREALALHGFYTNNAAEIGTAMLMTCEKEKDK